MPMLGIQKCIITTERVRAEDATTESVQGFSPPTSEPSGTADKSPSGVLSAGHPSDILNPNP